jgi:hypothetical protein
MKLAAAFLFVCLLAAGGAAAYAHDGRPHGNAARGVVLTGLERARPTGPCRTGFELRLPNGRIGCTHGPDPAPAGRDVREPVSLNEIAALTTGDPGETGTGSDRIACVGDGVDGNRVQAVYAYPAGGPDNFDEVAPYIRQWAALTDRIMNESAAKTGGIRHVRYVTDLACQLDVAKVALSEQGVASLSGTTGDLAAQGLDRPDRKYLVWADAYVYCGIATVEPDDRADQHNANNGGRSPGMVGRIDRGCWGNSWLSAEAHELVHILGGVQPTSPHGTWNYHCSDEWELMCYDDDSTADGYVGSHGTLVPIAQVCPKSHEGLLDCGDDDYFSTNPAPDSWLAEHWNVANSSFLTSEGSPVSPDNTAPGSTGPAPMISGRLGHKVPILLEWKSNDPDVAGYWLWKSVNGRPWKYVNRPDLWKNSLQMRLPHHRSYRFLVHAFDASGNASAPIFGPTFRPRVFQERNRQISYQGGWRRLYRSEASRRHLALPHGEQSAAKLRFYGKAIAWVSHTSLEGGVARVRIDGRSAALIDLTSTTPAAREVVFSKRFKERGWHRIGVVPVVGSGPAAVDAFVVLR